MIKTTFLILGVVVFVVICGIAGVIWMLSRQTQKITQNAQTLAQEFALGTAVDNILNRAQNLGAKEFDLYSFDRKTNIKSVFSSLRPDPENYQKDIDAFVSEFKRQTEGNLVVIFPGFMVERAVVNIMYKDSKIVEISTRYLD